MYTSERTNTLITGPQRSGKTTKALELVQGKISQQLDYLEAQSAFDSFKGINWETTHLIIEGVPATPDGFVFVKKLITTRSFNIGGRLWTPHALIFTSCTLTVKDFEGRRRLDIIEL